VSFWKVWLPKFKNMSFWRIWWPKIKRCHFEGYDDSKYNFNYETVYKVTLDKYQQWNGPQNWFGQISTMKLSTKLVWTNIEKWVSTRFYFINNETCFNLVSANNSIVQKFLTILFLSSEIDFDVIPMDSSGTSSVLR